MGDHAESGTAPTGAVPPAPTAGSLVGNRTAGSAPDRGTGGNEVTGCGAVARGLGDAVWRVVCLATVRAGVGFVAFGVVAFGTADVVAVGVGSGGTVVFVVAAVTSAAGAAGSPRHPATRVRGSTRRGTAYRCGRRIGPPLCPFRPLGTSTVHGPGLPGAALRGRRPEQDGSVVGPGQSSGPVSCRRRAAVGAGPCDGGGGQLGAGGQ